MTAPRRAERACCWNFHERVRVPHARQPCDLSLKWSKIKGEFFSRTCPFKCAWPHMWPPMGQHGARTFHTMETLQAALVGASRTCSLGNITRHSLGLSRRGVLLRRTQQSGGASLLQGEGAEGLIWDRKGAARPDASCPGETGGSSLPLPASGGAPLLPALPQGCTASAYLSLLHASPPGLHSRPLVSGSRVTSSYLTTPVKTQFPNEVGNENN